MAHMPYDHDNLSLPPRPKRRIWLWVLLSVAGVMVLSCGGCLTFLFYVGLYTPDTAVYAGNQVPSEFVDAMRAVGALEEGEKIRFFYSDALFDIRDGFYFVSDQRVVVYQQEAATPLTTAPFDEIESVDITRGPSWWEDGQIILLLKDGTPVGFPISREEDGDLRFLEEIQKHIAPDSADNED